VRKISVASNDVSQLTVAEGKGIRIRVPSRLLKEATGITELHGFAAPFVRSLSRVLRLRISPHNTQTREEQAKQSTTTMMTMSQPTTAPFLLLLLLWSQQQHPTVAGFGVVRPHSRCSISTAKVSVRLL